MEEHIGTLAANILVILNRAPDIIPPPVPIISEPAQEEVKSEQARVGVKEKVKRTRLSGTISRKIWGFILLAAGVLVLVALGLILTWGIKILPLAEKIMLSTVASTQVPFTSSPVRETKTVPATMTATPIPAWVNDFSEPIVNAIADRPPDFQDDFSYFKPDWELPGAGTDCPGTSESISNGRLQINPNPDCWAGASLDIHLSNFVIQIDTYFPPSVNLEPDIEIGKTDVMLDFSINFQGQWNMVYNDFASSIHTIHTILERGVVQLIPDHPATIQWISFGTRNAIYINGLPLYYFADIQPPGMKGLIIHMGGDLNAPNALAEFDNLKIWDLDKIENLSSLLKQ